MSSVLFCLLSVLVLGTLGYEKSELMRRERQRMSINSPPHVSSEDLARLEHKYGGVVQGVVTSEGDSYGVHQGGDRFGTKFHNYGPTYAEYLNKLWQSQATIQQVAEVGILKGSGLAMWLELFPSSKVYGFDIDPSNFESNRPNLKKEGMNDENLKITKMDQTVDNKELLRDQIGGVFSFVVDDGCHTPVCARLTIKSFLPLMSEKFVYIIEDRAATTLQDEIKGLASGIDVEQRGDLTVVSRGL